MFSGVCIKINDRNVLERVFNTSICTSTEVQNAFTFATSAIGLWTKARNLEMLYITELIILRYIYIIQSISYLKSLGQQYIFDEAFTKYNLYLSMLLLHSKCFRQSATSLL